MENKNPYAVTGVRVADSDQVAPMDESNPLFAAGVAKVVVMSLVTFGIYELYWMYRHWRLIQGRDRSDIMPFWRAFFGIFYVYSLFKRMRSDGEAQGITDYFPAGALAAGYILASLTWRMPEPWGLIGFATIAVFGIAQAYANKVNIAAAPNHERNQRFSGLNWLGIVVGGMFLMLILVALIFGDDPR